MKTVSGHDRLQALLRIRCFQDDLQKIKDEHHWKLKENLKSKFLDKYAIHFDDVEFVSKHFPISPQSSDGKDSPNIKGLCKEILTTSAVTMLGKTTADSHFEQTSLQSGKYISHGIYVAVLVDFSQGKGKILSDFENFIELTVRRVTGDTHFFEETRGQKNGFQYSIWHVYDLCSQKKKPNFTDVARQLSGKTGQAREDEALKASLKAVKRAYKRAKEIMREVEKTIPK